MQGYTIRVAKEIKNADGDLPGVRLGRLCIERDVAVADVARILKVTRQTVYRWFCGKALPHPHHRKMIEELLSGFPASDT